MLSTAISRCATAVAIALSCAISTASAKYDVPPRILQEPVLGLRYEAAKAGFDVLQDEVWRGCKEYSGSEKWGVGRLWIFATAHDAARSYYVVGGYWERRQPGPSESRYELDRFGGVISVDRTQCIGYGQAREVFDARYFDDIPQPILQQLAVDLAARLVRAFGDRRLLQRELSNQRIDLDSLPAELREAFLPLFPH